MRKAVSSFCAIVVVLVLAVLLAGAALGEVPPSAKAQSGPDEVSAASFACDGENLCVAWREGEEVLNMPGASPVPASSSPGTPYFPTEVGHKWQYQWWNTVEVTGTMTETVMVTGSGYPASKIISIAGPWVWGWMDIYECDTYVSFYGKHLSKLWPAPPWFWGVAYLAMPPFALLLLPPHVGQTWSYGYWSSPSSYYTATQTVDTLSDVVAVPAGVFTDSIRLSAVITSVGYSWPAGERNIWLAPGVGLVKLVYTHTNGSVTTVELTDHRVVAVAPVVGTVRLQGRTDYSRTTVRLGIARAPTKSDGSWQAYVEPVVYTAEATCWSYLGAERPGVTVSLGVTTTLPSLTLPGGDADRDNDIDIRDLTRLGAAFGTSPPSDYAADINGDGAVNIFDLVLVGINYGMVGPRPWP